MNAHLLRGRNKVEAGRYQEALADFQAAVKIPANLPSESVNLGSRSAEIAYWTGAAYDGMGDREKAVEYWNKGAALADAESSRRAGAGSRSSRQAAQPYYQALCFRRLAQEEKARAIFEGLVTVRTTGASGIRGERGRHGRTRPKAIASRPGSRRPLPGRPRIPWSQRPGESEGRTGPGSRSQPRPSWGKNSARWDAAEMNGA